MIVVVVVGIIVVVVVGVLEGLIDGKQVETSIAVGCPEVGAKLGEIEGLDCGLRVCVGMLEGIVVTLTVGKNEGVQVGLSEG